MLCFNNVSQLFTPFETFVIYEGQTFDGSTVHISQSLIKLKFNIINNSIRNIENMPRECGRSVLVYFVPLLSWLLSTLYQIVLWRYHLIVELVYFHSIKLILQGRERCLVCVGFSSYVFCNVGHIRYMGPNWSYGVISMIYVKFL